MRGTVIDFWHVQCPISIYNYRDNRDNKVHYRNNKNFIIAHPYIQAMVEHLRAMFARFDLPKVIVALVLPAEN